MHCSSYIGHEYHFPNHLDVGVILRKNKTNHQTIIQSFIVSRYTYFLLRYSYEKKSEREIF